MATIKVSGQAQLLSALKSAHAGDTLSLAGGNYGSINIPRASNGGAVTITSASDSNQAVFQNIKGSKLSNFTIDNVKFDGPGGAGGGVGLTISGSTNVKVINSDFTDYKIASFLYSIEGLTVSNNTFARMYHDAMDFTEITNGVISKNVYRESNSQPGYTHKDFIQFWTNAQFDQGASKNVKIVGNSFYSADKQTHGIFINNEVGTEKYQNIYIADNYLKSSHTHAITVDYANALEIRNNTIIKDGGSTPVINVTPDSTNVKIISNTVPSVPDQGNSSWTVQNNKETISNAYHWTDGKSGAPVKNVVGSGSSASAPANDTTTTTSSNTTTSSDLGNGHADEFRFDGAKLTGGATKTVSGIDFSEGDKIVLVNYDNGTIKDVEGGNLVWNNSAGTYVKIDSVADLHEIVNASSKISAKVSGDVLTLDVAQNDGVHHIVLNGLGHDYLL